jgi:hypothetical protein
MTLIDPSNPNEAFLVDHMQDGNPEHLAWTAPSCR